MVVPGRRKSIAFFIAMGTALIAIAVVLYVGWVLLNWRHGILLALGILMLAMIIAGIVLNTIFLVREIRRNEQHDAFINAVTHELKTPVASIRLYLQTLQARPVDESKRQQFYSTMLSDTDRLMDAIEQVLRTGRIGDASHKPNLGRVDMDVILGECVDRSRALHHLDAESLLYRPSGPVSVLGDVDEVRAALSNLIDNAVKYSHKPVRVTVEADTSTLGFIAVRVRDQGIGIAPVELKRVFKRFYRVPGPIASRVKGTGLGLYIVRSVAKRHGGRVWAESEGPGRGSTFVLQLPIAR